MAIKVDKINDSVVAANDITNITEYPNSFKRQGAFPLEKFSLFNSLTDAQAYASSNPVAYVGQLLTVVSEDKKGKLLASDGGDVDEYMSLLNVDPADVIGKVCIVDQTDLDLRDWVSVAKALVIAGDEPSTIKFDIIEDYREVGHGYDTVINLYELVPGGTTVYVIKDTAGTLEPLATGGATGDIEAELAELRASNSADHTRIEGLITTEKNRAEQAESDINDRIDDLADVATSGAAADVSIADAEGKITATTVEGALTELATSIETATTDLTVTIDDSATTEGMLKTYDIKQGGTSIGKIDIPKDLVVVKGSVETVTEADKPYAGAKVGDKYIDLQIANQKAHLYIPVKDLVDIYTGGTTATVKVEVGSDNVITANIVAGSIGRTHLDAAVKAELDLADTAVQTIETGDTEGTIKVDGTEVGVAGWDTMKEGLLEDVIGDPDSDTKDSDTIEGAKRYADDVKSTLEGTDSSTKDSATIAGAKAYAKDLVDSLDLTDSAVANQFVTTVSQENGKITVGRAQPVIANIDGLQDALDGKVDKVDNYGLVNVVTDESAGTATISENGGNSVTVYDSSKVDSNISTAKSDVIGKSGDEKTADTIFGAKAYADDKLSTALTGLTKGDTAVANQFVTAVSEENGIITVTRDGYTVAGATDYAANVTDKIATAKSEVVGGDGDTVDSLTLTGLSKRIAAEESARSTADSNIIGTSSDDSSKLTLNGLKAYADEVADGSLDDAKEYVDTELGKLDYTDTKQDHQFVTSVTQENGKITSVTRAGLTADDIPNLTLSKITDAGTAAASDVATVAIGTENESAVALPTVGQVETYVTEKVKDLTGAMHFRGVVTPNEGETDIQALTRAITNPKAGDVALVGVKEYVYTDASVWREFGDEAIYAVKGDIVNSDIAANAAIEYSKLALTNSIVNADIANNAAIDQSKIAGLSDSLDAKVDKTTTIAGLALSANIGKDALLGALDVEDGAQVNILEGVQVAGTDLAISNKKVNIPIATASALGLVKSSSDENKVSVDTTGVMEVNSLNVNKLTQTEGDTLILDGGASANA